jgi:hypothetical protein
MFTSQKGLPTVQSPAKDSRTGAPTQGHSRLRGMTLGIIVMLAEAGILGQIPAFEGMNVSCP